MPGDRVLRAIARGDLNRHDDRAARQSVDELADDFPRAIEDGELSLHFQPIIEVRTGRCYRAEALVRWVRPTAVLDARDVVRLAELTGSTLTLATWAISEAIRQRVAWQRDDLELGLALNLVGSELAADGAERIVSVIKTARARPAAFTFEVPATAFARDHAVREGARTLAAAGARVSLDDVAESNAPDRAGGLDVDELKISRSVVLRAAADAASALSLRRLVAVGRDLGLVTVAVGVEDEATFELLGGLACDLAQGYWMSRPLATADVARWHARLARAALTASTAAAAFTGLAKIVSATAPAATGLAGPGVAITNVATQPGSGPSCCALRAGAAKDVGVNLRTVAVDGATVHVEGTLSDGDAARIADAVSRDVKATQDSFGMSFKTAPDVYVFASRGSFALGLQRGFGQRATDASALAAGNGGVAFGDRAAVAINWENVRTDSALAIVRHELTHLMSHQIAGPNAEIPAWFDEGLATLMERDVAADPVRDLRHASATMALLHRGDVSLQDLSSGHDWAIRNAALGGKGYTLAASGAEVLRHSLGVTGLTALLERTRTVGFEQAFGEATGGSTADFASSFPGRYATLHGAPQAIAATAPDGVVWTAAGLAADARVRVTIEGTGYHVEFDATTDRDGTYTAAFGSTVPAGDYTVTVQGSTGRAALAVHVGR